MPGVNGYPSVTEVIQAVGLGYDFDLPPDKLDWALKRGTALHAAIELDATGELDEESIHPEIAGRLHAYRQWAKDVDHEVIASELEIISARWKFCGHVDRIGYSKTRRQLIDFKSSTHEDAVRLQLAGYAILYRERYPNEPIDDYVALQLNTDGTYVVHTFDPRADEQDFLAALIVYKRRTARNKKNEVMSL